MTDLLTIAIRAARAVPVVAASGSVRTVETPDGATLRGVAYNTIPHITLMKSAAYRSLTKSGYLALSRVMIELAAGRSSVSHHHFRCYGIARDSITAAICEIERLGFVVVERRAAKANAFDWSQRWRSITTVAQAKAIRDRARHFGITRRKKLERAAARRERGPPTFGTFRCKIVAGERLIVRNQRESAG